MLKNCLAAEWAQYGIRTNTISPGYMDTILNEGDGIMKHRQIWAERNPSGRMGSPSELTGTVVLLTNSAGTYINGRILWWMAVVSCSNAGAVWRDNMRQWKARI